MEDNMNVKWIWVALAVIALGGVVWKFGIAGVIMLAVFDAALYLALKAFKAL
jgi:hypothetical protein